MPKAAFFTHPVCLQHGTSDHVERPQRLSRILSAIDASAVGDRLARLIPTEATAEQIERVHPAGYVAMIDEVSRRGGGYLDADTVLSRESAHAARLAAGAAVQSVEAVLRDGFTWAFSACRPPGHHALPQEAMGFCLINNAAVAVKHAQAMGLSRVLVVDWDVHHGNGTQDVFYADPNVLFFSVHQSPLYPGTGRLTERGEGGATGTTLNVPLPPGMSDAEYLQVFERVLRPAALAFAPQLIVVSAGFDAHAADPLANMDLSTSGFGKLAADVRSLAEATPAQGRMVAVLEGGYDLAALSASVVEVLSTWSLDETPDADELHAEPDQIAPAARRVIERIEEINHP